MAKKTTKPVVKPTKKPVEAKNPVTGKTNSQMNSVISGMNLSVKPPVEAKNPITGKTNTQMNSVLNDMGLKPYNQPVQPAKPLYDNYVDDVAFGAVDPNTSYDDYMKNQTVQPVPQQPTQQPTQTPIQQPQPTQPTQPAQPTQQPQDLMSLIGNDPFLLALYNNAIQTGNTGSKQALEMINSKGLLNSTIATDRVAQIQQQSMNELLPKVLQYRENQKLQEEDNKRQAIADAYNRINLTGVVSEADAAILGLPVGFKPYAVQQDELQRQDTLNQKTETNKQQAINDAWNRVNILGYVDEAASAILGIPVGTKPYQVTQNESSKSDAKKAQDVSNAYTRWQTLGYADNYVSKILGIPVGTKPYNVKQQEIENKQTDKQINISASKGRGGGRGSSGGGGSSSSKVNPKEIRDEYINTVVMSRKRKIDAREQLKRDEAKLKKAGLSPSDIKYLYDYINRLKGENGLDWTGPKFKPSKPSKSTPKKMKPNPIFTK